MAKQKGRKLLVKIKGTGSTYDVLCGLTTKTLTINNEEVDVTTPDCDAPDGPLWTEVLDGVRRISFSGNGLSKKDDAEKTLVGITMADTPIAPLQIIVPNVGKFEADFFIQSGEFGGEQTGGVTFSMSAGSTGSVKFTAEADDPAGA